MHDIEREAAPLRNEKRERDHEIVARAFVWAFIMLMALSEVAGLIFVILKLTRMVTWTWPVTLIPIWILLAMIVTAATLLALANKVGKNR
jgi:hypothetical protein